MSIRKPHPAVRPRLLALASLCLSLGAFARAEPPPDRVLTLEDSIRLAMNNSQALLTSREDVNIALQRVHESESLFFPKLDLNANWSKFSVEGDRPMLLEPELGQTVINNIPNENFYSARANIYQTVYEGGRLRNTWRQARISYERARSANEALQNQVTSAAKQAFYDLLFAQEKNREYQALIQRLQALSAESRNSVLEKLRLEDDLGRVRTSAADSNLAMQQATLAYLRTLNLELNTTVQLKGDLETKPVELELPKMLAWANQYRSELRQTEYQQELDALGISLSLAERTPTVGFGATYERTGPDFNLQTTNW
ncbi:MAG TPA: TolC family protein, partial [Elusimicrobiota bacterium]|nr:TolC family protein [Elusimicrobiota bacterium]